MKMIIPYVGPSVLGCVSIHFVISIFLGYQL